MTISKTAYLFRHLDQVAVDKVGVTRSGTIPPMVERPAHRRKVLARHGGLTGGNLSKVV